MLLVRGEHRALGIHADDEHLRAVLLEVAPDAGDRAARSDGDDDRVDLASVGLLPDLGAGRLVVRLGVGRIRVLVGLEAARDLLREPVGDRVVALGRVRLDRGGGDHDLRAVRAEHRDLLLAHLVGHDEDAAVAAERRGHREACAGVARGRLDDRPARPQASVLLRRLDHRHPDPVLHGPARIQELELREELAGDVAPEPVEPDDRGPPDELEDVRVLAAGHRRAKPNIEVRRVLAWIGSAPDGRGSSTRAERIGPRAGDRGLVRRQRRATRPGSTTTSSVRAASSSRRRPSSTSSGSGSACSARPAERALPRRGDPGGLPRPRRRVPAARRGGGASRSRAWDFFHCPSMTEHIFVGAGDGPVRRS